MDSSSCLEVDDKLNDDILKVVEDHKAIESDDFKRIFWEQQVITGFVDYGQQNLNHRFSVLSEEYLQTSVLKKRTVATHMFTMMVRGVFFKMDFPFAQFATTGLKTAFYYA